MTVYQSRCVEQAIAEVLRTVDVHHFIPSNDRCVACGYAALCGTDNRAVNLLADMNALASAAGQGHAVLAESFASRLTYGWRSPSV